MLVSDDFWGKIAIIEDCSVGRINNHNSSVVFVKVPVMYWLFPGFGRLVVP